MFVANSFLVLAMSLMKDAEVNSPLQSAERAGATAKAGATRFGALALLASRAEARPLHGES